jgi:Glycosyl hydrolase family 30 TIM-barrel domain
MLKLTPAQRTALLEQLFDTEQRIGLAILRQPMGSSDFSVADYSYDDVPPGAGAYCGLEDAARLWSSAVRSNSVLARSRAFISLYNFPN